MSTPNTSQVPTAIANFGLVGEHGKTAATCTTYALDIQVQKKKKRILFHTKSETNYNKNRLIDPWCPNTFVKNEARPQPEPREILNPDLEAFESFLNQNAQKLSLAQVIRSTVKCIAAKCFGIRRIIT